MKHTNILSFLFCLSIGEYVCTNAAFNNKKTFFTFSGDSNLNTSNGGDINSNELLNESGNNENGNMKIHKIVKKEKSKMADASNESVKDSVDKASEAIKKEYKLKDLPASGLSEEDEEEAREDSEFLSNDLEEAAQNFSSYDEQNNPETETDEKNVKKYQAEVINTMNHDTVYEKFDTRELEKIEQAMEDSDKICLQDFSLPCPLEFFRTSSGCVPLDSYKGPCRKVQDKLMYLYDNQKESWGEICDAIWPCQPQECPHGTDYGAVCPINWIDIGKGICKSLEENEKCNKNINFSNISIDEKKKMESDCGIRWRCKSAIFETNFDSVCPLNWEKIGESRCKAPINYDGPCPRVANLKKYNSHEHKKMVEIACLVNWPYTLTVNQYQRDYSVPCPIGWSLMDNGFCLAPENYKKNDKCNDVIYFGAMNSQQKESYSNACQVDFPFKERNGCMRNYSYACPLGWVPSEKNGFCKSPINYKSSICKKYAKFENISDSQKNYFLNVCSIDWPCEGEIQNSMIYTQIPVAYATKQKEKSHRGPVDSTTGAII
ncbi:CPW-WPC family protein [Plasmodium gonderi]|uniref:CPW-WPC family protein n=1 Tax=Plasmodium gonderi TaxID=77519 RepID=A0A1Y1JI45_PLAGO|nr:CPW-WPC family protein [Plasmodium gonderi]GAW82181.1 CPW-WPC family protein [Plasmodium gonderi]